MRVQESGAGIPVADRRPSLPLQKCVSASGVSSLSETDAKRVLIIDRSILRRECLALMLSSRVEEFEFLTANSPAEISPDQISPDQLSAVLLAIGISSDDLCQAEADVLAIRTQVGDCPVIAIADSEDSKVAIELLRMGLRGYISTTFDVGLALAAIKLVCFGGTFLPPCAMGMLRGAEADSTPPSARAATQELTVREEQIVQHLRSGAPNKIIAYSLGISESTVKVHLHNIMRKMHATNRTEVASRSQELGLGLLERT